jgi:hypothetical protein
MIQNQLHVQSISVSACAGNGCGKLASFFHITAQFKKGSELAAPGMWRGRNTKLTLIFAPYKNSDMLKHLS